MAMSENTAPTAGSDAQPADEMRAALLASESILPAIADLLNAVQQAVIATDAGGRITLWNRHAEALYGWPAHEAIGRSIFDVLASSGHARFAGQPPDTLAQGKTWHGELEIQRRDGSRLFAEVTDSPVFDSAGAVVGIIRVSQDISERRRLQQNERMLAAAGHLLAESLDTEERVSRIVNLLVEQFAEACTILLIDEAGEPILFKTAHRDPAKEPLLVALAQYTPALYPTTATARVLSTGQPIFMPVVSDAFKRSTTADERHAELREKLGFHSMITLPLIAHGNTLGAITVARSSSMPEYHPQDLTFMLDISHSTALFVDNARLLDQARAMNAELEQRVLARTAELRESQLQLRQLTARLQSTREDERRRIAREVHDVIGQLLMSLKLEAGRLDLKLTEAGSPLAEHTASMLAMLDGAFQRVRQIATDLRPNLLDDMGLIAALEWQVEDFRARTGLSCRFDSTLDTAPLGNDASIAIFRVLQEALTNIARHAGASRVDVTVEEDHRGWFVLRIHDNGRGITASDLRQTQSLGLVGMRERVHLLGGEFSIAGEPGKGTLLIVSVPMGDTDATQAEAAS